MALSLVATRSMALLGMVLQDPLYLVGRYKSFAEAVTVPPWRKSYQELRYHRQPQGQQQATAETKAGR